MKERVYNMLHERDYNGKSKYVVILLFRVETVFLFSSSRKNRWFLAHGVRVRVVSIDDSKITGVSLAINIENGKCAVEALSICFPLLEPLFKRGFPPDRKGKYAWEQFCFENFSPSGDLSNPRNDWFLFLFTNVNAMLMRPVMRIRKILTSWCFLDIRLNSYNYVLMNLCKHQKEFIVWSWVC